MEKKVRNRTPRGSVEGVANLAARLLRSYDVAEVRRLLTEAGIPAKILDDGIFLGVERRFLQLVVTNEAVQSEQVEIGEAVSERSEPHEAGESRKPAARRNPSIG